MYVRMTRPLTNFGETADKRDRTRHKADTIGCSLDTRRCKGNKLLGENETQSEVLILIEHPGPEVDANVEDRVQTSKVSNNLSPEIENGKNFAEQPDICNSFFSRNAF